MAPRSERWKALERIAAAKLGGERVVIPWDLFQQRPDCVVDDFRLVIDCKAHERFSHHSLLSAVREKYCSPGDVEVLVTKHAGQVGEYATVPLDFFASLLNEVRGYRNSAQNQAQGDKSACGKVKIA